MLKLNKIIIAIIILAAIWVVASYNGLVTKQENVAKSWGQVQATYQRRIDLIPNLVATVKGYANHEKSTLEEVTKARTLASQSMGSSLPANAKQLQQFSASQAALSSSLGRLMVVVERYPDLKASENFLTLQSQLEGTENRINVARERFNNAVQTYDVAIRRFPTNIIVKIIGGFDKKPYFKSAPKADQATVVNF